MTGQTTPTDLDRRAVSSSLQATVVITTKNRKSDLAKAIESAMEQTAAPEVLVIDDGSTDGTSEMIRDYYPRIRVHRDEISRGYIVQRNRAAALARGDIIFSIDDDAVFSTPRTVEQTLSEFNHPRIGAVAIPFIDVNKGPQVNQLAPAAREVFAAFSYIGTAHAVRRELFLSLGGYREFLFHQGEESDLNVRMLAAGFIVRLGRADAVLHYESSHRDFKRMDMYGRRNDVLYAWHNVPMLYFPMHLLATTFKGLLFGWKCRRPLLMAQGVLNGYASIFHELRQRRPVSCQTYRISRLLKKRGAVPLEEIEPLLNNKLESVQGKNRVTS